MSSRRTSLSMPLVILRKACRFSRYISLALPAGQWQTFSQMRGQYLRPHRPVSFDISTPFPIFLPAHRYQEKGSKQLTRSKASERSEEPHTALREAKAVVARRGTARSGLAEVAQAESHDGCLPISYS